MAALLATTLAGCDVDGSPTVSTSSSAPATGVSTTSPATTSTTAAAAGNVTLSLTGVRLVNSEESDNALRVLFDSAAADVSVTLTGIPSPNRVVLVCPAAELDRPVRAQGGCATPSSGETVKVAHGSAYKGVEVVQVGVAGTGPAANSTTVGEITVAYPATSREVRLRLPPLREGESGGRPSLRMSPVGSGAYRASATWSSTGGGTGEAELVLVAGSSTVSRARGGPGSMLNGNLSPPAEATYRFGNTGSVPLLTPTLTLLFP